MKFKSLINDISNHFKHWEYGFIEGIIFGILLMFSNDPMFTMILLTPVMLCVVLISGKIVYPYLKDSLGEYVENKPRGCPECGNLTRHKKGCSYAKKKVTIHDRFT